MRSPQPQQEPAEEARFVIHLWTEPREDERRAPVMRGSVTPVETGEAAYFETLVALDRILAAAMGRDTLFGEHAPPGYIIGVRR
ncbi:MAG: hypothetical protein RKE49_00100 [Oceanicaulis sp.]